MTRRSRHLVTLLVAIGLAVGTFVIAHIAVSTLRSSAPAPQLFLLDTFLHGWRDARPGIVMPLAGVTALLLASLALVRRGRRRRARPADGLAQPDEAAIGIARDARLDGSTIIKTLDYVALRVDPAQSRPPAPATPAAQRTVTFALRIRALADGGFLLESASDSARFRGGQTYHETLEDALRQAKTHFGVRPDDWIDVV